MTVKLQKPIKIINQCNAQYDEQDLIKAILWYNKYPLQQIKRVYLHGLYPAISILKEKIHIHRILMMYWLGRKLMFYEHCHHIDGNKLNAIRGNMAVTMASKHLSSHNTGKIVTQEQRKKISESNRRRKGMKFKKRINIPMEDFKKLLNDGKSINYISKYFNCDWSTIKNRMLENPDLLK